jgi:PAS domain S-box-containing protein
VKLISWLPRFIRTRLAYKFCLVFLLIITSLCVIIYFAINSIVTRTLYEQHKLRGVSIAANLASNAVDFLLVENFSQIQLLLKNTQKNEQDAVYLFVLDAKGRVPAHTFPGGFPSDLKNLNQGFDGQPYNARLIKIDHLVLQDISVPVLDGSLGYVHLGFSRQTIEQQLQDIRLRIFFVCILACAISIILAVFFSRRINRPISNLTNIATAMANGDLEQQIDLRGMDEVATLACSFSHMRDSIRRTIADLERENNERRQAAKELNDAYDIINKSRSVAFLWKNVEGWPVEFVSTNVRNLFGYSADDFTSGRISYGLVIHPEDVSRAAQEVVLHGEMEDRLDFDHAPYRIITKDGQVKWLSDNTTIRKDSQGRVTHFQGIVEDITQRKQAEDERDRLISAIEQADEIIVITDSSGTILYVNPVFEKVTGYASSEALGENPRILKSGEHDEAYYQQMWKTITSGETWNGRIVNRKKDGSLYTEEMSISPVLDRSGRTIHYVAVKRDITHVLHLEKQLRLAQKMEVIGLMAGGVAHDLNNILAGIVGYPDLLLMTLTKDSELRKPIMDIREAGKRAAAVVDDLLTVARGAAKTRAVHDLNQLVREYLHSPEYKKLKSLFPGVEWQSQLAAAHSSIVCSPLHIKKVVMNLVTNAAEAIVDQGSVIVSTSNQYVDEAAGAIQEIAAGEYVVLKVQDTGPGISVADAEHIFEPFYTKKTMGRSGTGLGLTVVWNTVKVHEGKILVENKGQGTCFVLYFPVRAGSE